MPIPNYKVTGLDRITNIEQFAAALTDIISGGGAITSIFGRTGVVVATTGDYTAAQVGALASNAAAGGDLTGTFPNPTLAAIGSSAGPIGSTTTVPIVTIDAKGRVTALSSATIPLPVQPAPTAVKTGAYNASAGDFVLCNATSAFTVTLPTAPADQTTIAVKIVSGAHIVTVATGGSDVIDLAGITSIPVVAVGQCVILQYQHSTAIWYVQAGIASTKPASRIVITNAPGATPSINTDLTDRPKFTGLATAITSMSTNLTGTPRDGQTLWISFTDNGTARAITWGASFASSTQTLPTTTVGSARLNVGVEYDAAASIWQCMAVA